MNTASEFWARVDTTGDCWLWTGAKQGDGYGSVRYDGRPPRLAHRVAWELAHGKVAPSGLSVCHTCDVPACVRPSHLWLGTHAENMRDRNQKGRTARGSKTSNHAPRAKGSRNGHAKLHEAEIATIRFRRQSGEQYKTIAKDYGVTTGTIWKVTAGYSWTHAAAPSTASNQ